MQQRVDSIKKNKWGKNMANTTVSNVREQLQVKDQEISDYVEELIANDLGIKRKH